MKRRIAALVSLFVFVIALQGTALAAPAVGHAIYRDLNNFLLKAQGHAGITTGVSNGKPSTIVHMIGGFSAGIKNVSYSSFNSKNDTWGTFYKSSGSSAIHRDIANSAYEWYSNRPNVPYTIVFSAKRNTSLPSGTVTMNQIQEFRCDGFVEYCYEIRGQRVISGIADHWDITNHAHFSNHTNTAFTPLDQSLALTLSRVGP